MTKRTTKSALLVIGALVAAACGADGVLPSGPDFDAQFAKGGNKADKVDVCHVDDEGNIQKINVNGNALAGHLGHGDTLPVEGSCDVTEPSITVISSDFTVFPFGTLVSVTFAAANCDGDPVRYELVGADDGSLIGGPIFLSGDGPHSITGVIPPADTNTAFQVRGECQNGVVLSAPFAP